MKSFDELSIKDIVDEVENGCVLGIPADYSGVPMAFTKELIKKGKKGRAPYDALKSEYLFEIHNEINPDMLNINLF